MDTLFTAILVIGGIIVAAIVIGTFSELLEKATGRDLGTWFSTLLWTGVGLAIGYGGFRLIRWGMNDELLGLVIVGILVMVFGVFTSYHCLRDGPPTDSDPMSGKRAHYNKHGDLTGYSDKD